MEDLGKKGEKITYAFKLALENAMKGENITSKSQDLITVKIPKILQRPLAAFLNHTARKKSKEQGTDFARKAYLDEA